VAIIRDHNILGLDLVVFENSSLGTQEVVLDAFVWTVAVYQGK
jgi:hypothetical protein